MKRNILFYCFFSLILFQCFSKEYPIKIQYEDNIKIIHNPDYPKFKKERYIFNNVLTIGLEEGDDNFLFSKIRDIKVDIHGNIYILDIKNSRIQVFDNQGQYMRTIGSEGQGPGEFSNPMCFDFDEKNNIYIAEYSPGKIICFDKNGKYIRDDELKGDYRFKNIADFYYRHDAINLVVLKFRDNPKPDENPMLWEMIKADKKGYYLKTIESFEMFKGQNYKKLGISLGCEPHSEWTVDRIGNIYIGFSDKYEIRVYGVDGNLKTKIMRDCKLVKISEQEKEEELIGLPKSIKQEVVFPEYRPFFDKIIVDDAGNIWLRRFGKNKNNQFEFDIFNEEGTYIRKVNIDITPQYIKDNYIYAITETENGFPCVTKYKMEIL